MNGLDEHNEQDRRFPSGEEGRKYRHIAYTVIFVFAVCLLMVYLLFQASHVGGAISWLIGSLRAIFLGLLFGYLLNPLDNRIRRAFLHAFQKKGKLSPEKATSRSRGLGVALSSLFGIGIVFLLLMLIIPSFIESVSNLSSIISQNLDKVTAWVASHANSDDLLSVVVNKCVDAVQKWISEDLNTYAATATATILSAGMQMVFYVMDFFIAFIVAIYTLLEKETFARRSKKLLYACLKPARANRVLDICRHGNRIFGSFLSGKLLDSLIIGVLCFLLMTILRIPYAVLVSVVIGCTNIIPFLGPFIGGIPCSAIILLASPQKGIVFIIMFLILQQVDGNVIGPMILGDKVGVSAFWIICSLLSFKALFGLLGTGMSIFGMIIGVPLFCVIDYVVSQNVRERLKRKHMDAGELDFKDVESYDVETERFVPIAAGEQETSFSRLKGIEGKLSKFIQSKKSQKKNGKQKK